MTEMKNTIALRSCCYAYPGTQETLLFEDLSCTFQAGCPTLISGETGAGKTTLIQILSALRRPTRGECLVNGMNVSRWTSHFRDQWRKMVGILPQHPLLMGYLSAYENVTLPLMNRKMKLKEIGAQAEEMMKRLNLLHLRDQKAKSLSGGEAQRVGLARACIVSPDFLFLDEPSSHQDDKHLALMMTVLGDRDQMGTTVIAVSHDQRLHDHRFFKTKMLLGEGHLNS